MRPTELAGPVPVAAEALDELAVRRELRDASHCLGCWLVDELRAVRLGYVDAAVRTDHDVVRLGEGGRRRTGLARGSEHQKHLAVRTELRDGVTFAGPVRKPLQFVGIRNA